VGVSVWRQYRLWRVTDRPWTEADLAGYRANGCNGIWLRFERDVGRQMSLEFVSDLPDLECVDVDGPLRDDTPAFGVPTLKTLLLHTACSLPLDLTTSIGLVELGVDHRSNMESIRGLAALARLEVWAWRGSNLEFLGDKRQLVSLRLEGARRSAPTGSLAGIGGCSALEELTVFDAGLDGLEALRGLTEVTRIQITVAPGAGAPWDLSALESMIKLAYLTLTFCGPLQSLRPLVHLPALRDLRLRGTIIVDGDLSPLLELPPEVVVGPFEDQPHYSHMYSDIIGHRKQQLT
jgi:hypothetical protein